MWTVGILPAFYAKVDSPRYGPEATQVYHDRSECQRVRKILEDRNEQMGTGGRRRCLECERFGSV